MNSPLKQPVPPAPRSIRLLHSFLTVLLVLSVLGGVIYVIGLIFGLMGLFDVTESGVNSVTGMARDAEALSRLALPEGVTATAAVIEAPVTDAGGQLAIYSIVFVEIAAFIYLLVLARRFLKGIERADPDSFWDVSSLRRIGWVLIGYFVLTFIQGLIEYVLIERSIAAQVSDFPDQLFVSIVPAVAGLTAFAFAEVLRRGAQLHKDVEGTI